jgi:hypothetical protein
LPAARRSRTLVPVRTSARVALAILPLAFWLSAWAQPAAACSGGDAPLATGVRGASSIFYARILADHVSSVGFYDLQLKVGRVIRGHGQSHVVHLITPRACDSLAVGDVGVVVLGSVDPYGVGPHDIYNFFYVLGPGHTSAAEAAALLADLPATDTAPALGVRGSAPVSPALPLIGAAAVGIAVLVSRPRAGGPSRRGQE